MTMVLVCTITLNYSLINYSFTYTKQFNSVSEEGYNNLSENVLLYSSHLRIKGE